MQIALDFGNTRLKAGIFVNENLVNASAFSHEVLHPGAERNKFGDFLGAYSKSGELSALPLLILSAVVPIPDEFYEWIS